MCTPSRHGKKNQINTTVYNYISKLLHSFWTYTLLQGEGRIRKPSNPPPPRIFSANGTNKPVFLPRQTILDWWGLILDNKAKICIKRFHCPPLWKKGDLNTLTICTAFSFKLTRNLLTTVARKHQFTDFCFMIIFHHRNILKRAVVKWGTI